MKFFEERNTNDRFKLVQPHYHAALHFTSTKKTILSLLIRPLQTKTGVYQNIRHRLFLEELLPPMVCPLAIMLRVTASSRNMDITFQLNFALHSMCDVRHVFFTRWLISFRSLIWPKSAGGGGCACECPLVSAPLRLISGESVRMLLQPATLKWLPDSAWWWWCWWWCWWWWWWCWGRGGWAGGGT